jgi:hypothetical protein
LTFRSYGHYGKALRLSSAARSGAVPACAFQSARRLFRRLIHLNINLFPCQRVMIYFFAFSFFASIDSMRLPGSTLMVSFFSVETPQLHKLFL